jgi:hypothetical protein
MKCENCECHHDGAYGSGRFCTQKCARGFSTKLKRAEINRIVGEKLRKPFPKRICKNCNKIYQSNSRFYCSNQCWNAIKHTLPEFCATLRKPNVKRGTKGGPRPGGGHAKLIAYTSPYAGTMKINSDEARLAAEFDRRGLHWHRNFSRGFPYTDLQGRQRKFYPDFYIEDFDLYVEYKGWVIPDMVHKMNDAKENNDFNLLIVYSNCKRFSTMGITIDDVENGAPLI